MDNERNQMIFSVAKIIVAAGFIGIVLWKMPIIEMLWLFAVVCVVPVMFLGAFGIIGKDTLRIISKGARGFRDRVEAAMERLKEEAESEINQTIEVA